MTLVTKGVFICGFTALDDLPGKDRKSPVAVLRLLAETKRFSVFDANSPILARSLERIVNSGWAEFTPEIFPWTSVEVTEAGHEALKV